MVAQLLTQARSTSAAFQAWTAILVCLSLQYLLNILAIYEVFPDIAGKSLNGFTRNHTYLVPGMVAIWAAGVFEGGAGIRRIFRPYLKLFFNPLWWVFATCALLPLLLAAVYLDDLLYGRPLELYGIELPRPDVIPRRALRFASVAVSDELLWIGFVYPRLRYLGWSPLKASLALGMLWGLDYLPFLVTGFFVTPGMSWSTLLFGWFALTPLYFWVYHKTHSATLIVYFNICMQFSYQAIPIQPTATGTNSGMAMANLLTLLVGVAAWRFFPRGQKENYDFLARGS